MQKALEQSTVEQTGSERQLGGMGDSRSNEQTRTYLLQSKSPVLSHYDVMGTCIIMDK